VLGGKTYINAHPANPDRTHSNQVKRGSKVANTKPETKAGETDGPVRHPRDIKQHKGKEEKRIFTARRGRTERPQLRGLQENAALAEWTHLSGTGTWVGWEGAKRVRGGDGPADTLFDRRSQKKTGKPMAGSTDETGEKTGRRYAAEKLKKKQT